MEGKPRERPSRRSRDAREIAYHIVEKENESLERDPEAGQRAVSESGRTSGQR
jgi:hypothetical protein